MAEINEYPHYIFDFQSFRHTIYHSVKFNTVFVLGGIAVVLFAFVLNHLPILLAGSSQRPDWDCFLDLLNI